MIYSSEEKKNTLFTRIVFWGLLVSSVLGGMMFGYINSEIKNFSGIENLRQFQPSIPTKVYDVNGELIAELFQEKRELVAYEEIPHTLIHAFLATEDKNFYNHFGIDPVAIIRAMGRNVLALGVAQGGSTITQQLAKRLYTSSERTMSRKVLEAILALQIEKRFSKEEILEMYLNQIFLGHGCYGVSSASRLFFDKRVMFLTAAESSVLAALPSAPGRYSPFRNAHNAYAKNKDILGRMVREGYLSEKQAEKIYQDFWPGFIDSIKTEYPTVTVNTRRVDRAPYFTDYVQQMLVARYGKDVLYNEGLNVYTTLDLHRQMIAERVLKEGVARQNITSANANQFAVNTTVDRKMFTTYYILRALFNLPEIVRDDSLEIAFRNAMVDEVIDAADALSIFGDADRSSIALQYFRSGMAMEVSTNLKVEGALIAVETKTGYITSMVGGSGFEVDNQYNRAVQARRQPGSSFKPFIYGAGIMSKKITAATGIPDAPIMNINNWGRQWEPGNYGKNFAGVLRVREALARSVNIISIRIFDLVGPERIVDFATRMTKVPPSRLDANPSIALGTSELTPLEMATGYAVFANGGKDVIPFAIRYVLDREGREIANIEEEVGNILAIKEKENNLQVIPEDVNYIMVSLMRDVVDAGTANGAIRSEAGFVGPAAGKTGTTQDYTDAWFCGYTPEIAAVVWMGYDKPFMTLGPLQDGGRVSAPVWGRYMKEVYADMKIGSFPAQPQGVYTTAVCRYTGKKPAGPQCEAVTEVMLQGSGIVGRCNGKHYEMESIIDLYRKQNAPAEAGTDSATAGQGN